MILFEIITGKKAFEDYQIIDNISKDNKPSFDKKTPLCFIQLINKCWSKDQNERPSFSEISNELKTNKSFLIDVDKDIFMKYVNFIDNYESSNANLNFITKINLREIYQNFIKQLSINPSAKKIDSLDYCVLNKIGEGNFGVIYKIKKIENNRIFAAKISKTSIQNLGIEQLIDLYREINIISKLNHPCILKYIGFNENESIFHKNKIMIVTEFSKKSLSYLHHLNIIHRDLKPENILLDKNLYPKIADFGFSKDISEIQKYAPDPLYFLKGIPKYCSPEILSRNCYLKQGDIYAFGLIIFEIITNEIPFKNITDYYNLIREVVYNKATPLFPDDIQECYKKLIKSCLSYEPENRPTIDEILHALRDDSKFLTGFIIDRNEFNEYVDYIDDFLSHSDIKFVLGKEHEITNQNAVSELKIKEIQETNNSDEENKLKISEMQETNNSDEENKLKISEMQEMNHINDNVVFLNFLNF